jgi:hypothetical protein
MRADSRIGACIRGDPDEKVHGPGRVLSLRESELFSLLDRFARGTDHETENEMRSGDFAVLEMLAAAASANHAPFAVDTT